MLPTTVRDYTQSEVNKGSRDRDSETSKEWEPLKAEGNRLLETAIPGFNNQVEDAGIEVWFVK